MHEPPADLTPSAAADHVGGIVERVEEAVVIERPTLYVVLSAILARGHVLLEDVPGTGKTVTARVLAEALGLEFTRIQFTPDLLPADVTGSTVYDEHEGSFEFAPGPVFSNVVLADEINRAPPKTQAALLEAMEERQVSVDGTTHELPRPFVVIATQNPIEQEGTFRLPEAQRDRFSVKTSIGYPDVDGEHALLEKRANRRTIAPSVGPRVDPETVRDLQALTEDVEVDRKVRQYIIDLARFTREDPRTEIGVSPRGIQRVFETVRGAAVISGRGYAVPDDVKRVAIPAMSHRLVLTTEATVEGVDPRTIVRTALETLDVPGVAPGADETESTNGGTGALTADSGETPVASGPDSAAADRDEETEPADSGPSSREIPEEPAETAEEDRVESAGASEQEPVTVDSEAMETTSSSGDERRPDRDSQPVD